MVDALFHCFEDTNLFDDFDEYSKLVCKQPPLDSEELLFIENVINENIGKDITISRDEKNDRNYKLKIGNKDLIGTDRRDMELSNGEQNFISLTFELLLARHSNKEYVVIDDPISSFDSIYKNKIAYCIIKFLENKKQIILTHNTDLIRMLEYQYNDCFKLYILNNVTNGKNGFIPVSDKEKGLLIDLHKLIKFFQNKDNILEEKIHNKKQFLMSMIPFIRGYVHISLDKKDKFYNRLSRIMHGYNHRKRGINIISIYNKFFGKSFEDTEKIEVSVNDVLGLECDNLDIIDRVHFPLLADTLEQTLIYYHLRMKVEKELVDIFKIKVDGQLKLYQIIQKAFERQPTEPDYEKMREFRVFFASRKTLLNEFNHFEGNLNIFQPAIDITRSALKKEIADINNKLIEVRKYQATFKNNKK